MKQETRFNIDGIEFVSGLEWVTLDADGRERPRMLGNVVIGKPGPASRKELSRIEGAASAVWRTLGQGITQMGVSTGNPGAISLAAFVSGVLGQEGVLTFLAVFRINQGLYALVGAVDGLVQMSVESAGSEDEVRQRAQEELSVSDPNIVIIAPEGFGIGESRHDDIAQLIERAEKADFQAARLIRIAPDYRAFGIAAASVMLVAGGAGGAWYWYQQKQAEEQARIAQELLRQQMAQSQKPQQPVIQKVGVTPVSAALNACYQALNGAELYPGGWKLSAARCTPGGMTLEFQRDGSRIAFLRKVYPQATVSLDGNLAQVNVPVSLNNIQVDATALKSISDGADAINDNALSLGVEVSMTRQARPQPVSLPGRNDNAPPPPSWRTINWEIRGLAYGQVPSGFDFTGMSFAEMVYDGKGITVKGEFYGR